MQIKYMKQNMFFFLNKYTYSNKLTIFLTTQIGIITSKIIKMAFQII